MLKEANCFGEPILSLKDRLTAFSNSQNIRMLQTRVNNDIYNKYCLVHNNMNMNLKMSLRLLSCFFTCHIDIVM